MNPPLNPMNIMFLAMLTPQNFFVVKDDMWLQEMMLGCDTELFETVRKAYDWYWYQDFFFEKKTI